MTALWNVVSGVVSDCDPVLRAATDCLHENPELAGESVSCEYQQGILVLRGQVPTYYQKRIARRSPGDWPASDKSSTRIAVAGQCDPAA